MLFSKMHKRETAHEGFSESFALQFISLMLFILIFIVTANYAKFEVTPSVVAVEERPLLRVKAARAEQVMYETPLTATFVTDDFFQLHEEAWFPIFQMLHDHDVSLVITLGGDTLQQRVYKAEQLYGGLVLAGIPVDALRVETDPKASSDSIKLIKGDLVW
jgi:hypothetical protein